MTITVRRSPGRRMTMLEPFHRPIWMFDEVDRMLRGTRERMWDWTPREWTGMTLYPSLDVYEDKGELVVRGEFPGVGKDDLEVTVTGDMLRISAEKKEDAVSEDAAYYRRERRTGHYSRTMRLPYPVEADKVSATYQDGTLELRLPAGKETHRKHVTIEAGCKPKRIKAAKAES